MVIFIGFVGIGNMKYEWMIFWGLKIEVKYFMKLSVYEMEDVIVIKCWFCVRMLKCELNFLIVYE